jgi:hypothetical protein
MNSSGHIHIIGLIVVLLALLAAASFISSLNGEQGKELSQSLSAEKAKFGSFFQDLRKSSHGRKVRGTEGDEYDNRSSEKGRHNQQNKDDYDLRIDELEGRLGVRP